MMQSKAAHLLVGGKRKGCVSVLPNYILRGPHPPARSDKARGWITADCGQKRTINEGVWLHSRRATLIKRAVVAGCWEHGHFDGSPLTFTWAQGRGIIASAGPSESNIFTVHYVSPRRCYRGLSSTNKWLDRLLISFFFLLLESKL